MKSEELRPQLEYTVENSIFLDYYKKKKKRLEGQPDRGA